MFILELNNRDLGLVTGGGDDKPAPAPKQNQPPKPPPPPPEPRPHVPPVTFEGTGSIAVERSGGQTAVVGMVLIGIKW